MVTRANNITKIPDAFVPRTSFQMNEMDYETLVQSYIKEIAPTVTLGSRSGTGYTIDDFFKLVKEVVLVRQNTENVPESHRVLFLEDEPPEDLDTEAITFDLITREPGLISRGSAGSNGVREVTSQIRSVTDDTTSPGQKIVEHGRHYDHLIEFYAYARSPHVARQRVLWLEGVINSFYWLFFFYGFKVIENGITKKEKVKIGNLTLFRYPLSFFVRCDSLHYKYSQELREILIKINLQ